MSSKWQVTLAGLFSGLLKTQKHSGGAHVYHSIPGIIYNIFLAVLVLVTNKQKKSISFCSLVVVTHV